MTDANEPTDRPRARPAWQGVIRRVVVRNALVAALLVPAGCAEDPDENLPARVVARVGAREIERRELLDELAWRGLGRIETPEVKTRLAERIIASHLDEAVLEAAALAADITVGDEEVERAMYASAQSYPPGGFARVLIAEQMSEESYRERVRRRLLVDRYLERHLPREKVESATGDPRLLEERVRVRHLLVKSEEEANRIRDDIRGKRISLEDAARRYSIAPEASHGGDVGWFVKGQLPSVFDRCFDLEKGKISEVVASDYGFHLFEVIARAPAGPESPEAASARAHDEERVRQEEAALNALVASLKARFPVEVDDVAMRSLLDAVLSAPTPEPTPEKDPS